MRTIDKGREPACLSHRRREAARQRRDTGRPATRQDWSFPRACMDEVRAALLRDQRGLCAYCAGRIDAALGTTGRPLMKVEHFHARSDAPERMFEWTNLMGVCEGRTWDPKAHKHVKHCDTARGNKPLHIHPVEGQPGPRPERAFRFRRVAPSGRAYQAPAELRGVWVHGESEEAWEDIEVLNLNADVLVRTRGKVLKNLRGKLQLASHKNDEAAVHRLLKRALRSATQPDRHGNLPPFAPMIAAYARQHLEKLRR